MGARDFLGQVSRGQVRVLLGLDGRRLYYRGGVRGLSLPGGGYHFGGCALPGLLFLGRGLSLPGRSVAGTFIIGAIWGLSLPGLLAVISGTGLGSSFPGLGGWLLLTDWGAFIVGLGCGPLLLGRGAGDIIAV